MGKSLDTTAVESSLRSSIENVESGNSILSTKSSIFLTPKLLLQRTEKVYVPHAFSFGPLHHGKPDFTYTEEVKLKYTRDLISQVSTWNDAILKELVDGIASIEEEARKCYAVPVEFSREKFVEILLVDGCFLIELFRKKDGVIRASEDDPVMKRAYLYHVRDLYLLENQIPWLVLDHLFTKTTHPHYYGKSLTELAISHCAVRLEPTGRQMVIPRTPHQTQHLLELLRSSLVEGRGRHHHINYWELIPSASGLVEAGVILEKASDANGLLDIKFSNDGILKIPPFTIDESTERIFRNLVSFEQCYHSCTPVVTSYVILLDILINTPKDIDVLREKGIIRNWLNPQDAADIFNNLYNDTCLFEFSYGQLCKDVNEYCKRGWPRWRAIYVRNHFSSPWAIASQVLAAVLFILTLLQTVFTIKK